MNKAQISQTNRQPTINNQITNRPQRNNDYITSIYSMSFLTRTIVLPYTAISNNRLMETIEKYLIFNYEGKCVEEGFIKPGSIQIISHSGGTIENGNSVSFCVVFECKVCFLVEGTLIRCRATSITNAGIQAESANDNPNPITVFVANDHNYMKPYFSEVKEGDIINVRVIGQTFQLNDKTVSIIAELIRPTEKE